MTSLIKKLLSIFRRPKQVPVGHAINSPIIDIKSNHTGKYYKHKVMNNYVYIYGPLSELSYNVYEFVDEATINRLNALGLTELTQQLRSMPAATDHSSYHYYPRTCMRTLQIEEIETLYVLEDIYTANVHYTIFVTNCLEALARIHDLKNQAIEIISNENLNRPFGLNQQPLNNSILIDPIININYNPLNDDQVEQLNSNRFDKID